MPAICKCLCISMTHVFSSDGVFMLVEAYILGHVVLVLLVTLAA